MHTDVIKGCEELLEVDDGVAGATPLEVRFVALDLLLHQPFHLLPDPRENGRQGGRGGGGRRKFFIGDREERAGESKGQRRHSREQRGCTETPHSRHAVEPGRARETGRREKGREERRGGTNRVVLVKSGLIARLAHALLELVQHRPVVALPLQQLDLRMHLRCWRHPASHPAAIVSLLLRRAAYPHAPAPHRPHLSSRAPSHRGKLQGKKSQNLLQSPGGNRATSLWLQQTRSTTFPSFLRQALAASGRRCSPQPGIHAANERAPPPDTGALPGVPRAARRRNTRPRATPLERQGPRRSILPTSPRSRV